MLHNSQRISRGCRPITTSPEGYSNVDYLETWEGMEELRQIGTERPSTANSKTRPVVNQVEVNPNINQKDLIQFCRERDIVVVGFARWDELREHYHIHISTSYAILGVCVIPKSVNKSRILENFNIYDFELNEEDVKIFRLLQ
ncbi:hypothetical protein NQ317_004631 [Molorchus minor]|uniref:Uncharacterized protein n=1 Tax=Molorchus minor TaxID=1323400 RepID=A0ABQ9IR12_9CUCU|nr:hypothetical protein NQ317_004631 [Molorchus minor]